MKKIYFIFISVVAITATVYFLSMRQCSQGIEIERNEEIVYTPNIITEVKKIGKWEFLSIKIEELVDTTKGVLFKDQLSAIFNWVLQGYEMLKNCGYFTEPDDQKAITEEFKELSNPLIEFAKEVEVETAISNNQLYVRYKDWCEDSGHNALARNTFNKRIVKAFKEYRSDLEPYRTNKFRGWQPKGDSISPWD